MLDLVILLARLHVYKWKWKQQNGRPTLEVFLTVVRGTTQLKDIYTSLQTNPPFCTRAGFTTKHWLPSGMAIYVNM